MPSASEQSSTRADRRRPWVVIALALAILACPLFAESNDAESADRTDSNETSDGSKPTERQKMPDPHRLEQALNVLADIDADLVARIRKLKERNPDKAWELLRPHYDEVRRLTDMRQTDAIGYELRVRDIRLTRESRDLSEQIIKARARRDVKAEKAALEQLREVVDSHFEARQDLRRHEVELFERKLMRMREAIAERDRKRDQIIDAKVEDLIGGEELPEF